MATLSELALFFVPRFDFEATDINEACEGERDDQVGGYELRLVVPKVSPQSKVSALDDRANSCEPECDEGRCKSYKM